MLDLTATFPSVAESRAALLDAIGPAPDLTLLIGPGNRGDDLILAGTRALLAGHVYRDRHHDDLRDAGGDTVLILGSGAWCRGYHRTLPPLLAIAQRRYERVIVLPSTFDTGQDRVKEALLATDAIVFARELESYARIAPLCDARLAHDGAFFLDYEPYRRAGAGTLNAFRTDRESAGARPLPDDNDDVSATAPTLDAWLERIAGAARVRTDRAHVLIASALMGKAVEYAPGSYFKVDALAATLPEGVTVERIPDPAPAPPRAHGLPPAPGRERMAAASRATAAAPAVTAGRVEVIMLSHERHAHVGAAIDSVLDSSPVTSVVVLDANSGPATRAALAGYDGRDRVEVVLADSNDGCGVGRQRMAERTDTELVLFLDDDAELMPGALERLVAELDAHPEAQAVTPLVADPDGRVIHCGGTVEHGDDVISFRLDGFGLGFDDPAVPATGVSDWAPGCGLLVRRSLLLDCPFDPAMMAYYEDNDWSLRAAAGSPGPFRRCREAVVLHHLAGREPAETPVAWADHTCRRLAAHARFLEVHGALMHSGGEELRELLDPTRAADPAAARLLLRLVTAYGADWLLAEWAAGDVGALIHRARDGRAHGDARAAADAQRIAALEAEHAWLHERHATLARVEAGGWWRLRGRLVPALALARRVRRRLVR